MDTIDHTFPKEIEKIAAEIELDVLTTYRLADAIRDGASVTDQAHGWGSQGRACALTAAALACKARGL